MFFVCSFTAVFASCAYGTCSHL